MNSGEGQSTSLTWSVSPQPHEDIHELNVSNNKRSFEKEPDDHPQLKMQMTENYMLSEVGFQEHKNLVNATNMEANSFSITKVVDDPAEGDGLKKLDSFSRWMSKEFGDVDESLAPSDSGLYWNVEENQDVSADSELLSPSLSQEQLFSILDFSPNWVYSGVEAKACHLHLSLFSSCPFSPFDMWMSLLSILLNTGCIKRGIDALNFLTCCFLHYFID